MTDYEQAILIQKIGIGMKGAGDVSAGIGTQEADNINAASFSMQSAWYRSQAAFQPYLLEAEEAWNKENTEVSEMFATLQQDEEQQQLSDYGKSLRSTQETNFAKNGVDPTTGSALDVMTHSAMGVEKEKLISKYNYQSRMIQYDANQKKATIENENASKQAEYQNEMEGVSNDFKAKVSKIQGKQALYSGIFSGVKSLISIAALSGSGGDKGTSEDTSAGD